MRRTGIYRNLIRLYWVAFCLAQLGEWKADVLSSHALPARAGSRYPVSESSTKLQVRGAWVWGYMGSIQEKCE